MPRASSFTQEIADAICERIANGESLRKICEDADMPTARCVHKWLVDNEAFVQQYAQARDRQADYYADEIIEIADTATDAALARLQVDARKWKASKMAPKKYGDKVDVQHSGQVDTVVMWGGK